MDAREARQCAEDATFAANRLRTLRPRLLARYHEVSAAEQREQYLSRYTDLKHEGEALGTELAEVYPDAVRQIVEVFVRLRAFQDKCRALHLTDTGGGLPHIIDPEIKARRLDVFSRDQPSLLDAVRLYDWQSGTEVWPEKPTSFAATFAQSMVPQGPGQFWASDEVRARVVSEQQREREKMAAHYAQAAKEQEERQNKELKEQFQARQH
jgi:hypothetical protein